MIGSRASKQFRGGLTALRIHAHVERPFEFRRKTARRIVKLHRRNTEISENNVCARKICLGENFWKAGEISAMGSERVWTVAERTEVCFSFWQFDGISIEAEETSARLNARQNFLRVATVTERTIDSDLAWPGIQDVQNFLDHDRSMRAGGSFAGGENFGDSFGVTLGIVFFVLFFEPARVFAGVAGATAVS